MATPVMIKHEQSGMVKTGYHGFSWTYLLFGFWVPLFRGEPGIAALHFLFAVLTFGIWQLIVCFLYNGQYMTRMLTNGWKFADTEQNNALAGAALGVVTEVTGSIATPAQQPTAKITVS